MANKSWQWKPVKLGNNSTSFKGGGMASSSNNQWYDRLITLETNWEERLDRYRIMDTSVDITRALDIIAEDIASDDASDDEIFNLYFPEDANPKNSQIKTSNETLKLWEKKTKLDYKFFDYAREMIKNGCVMFEIGSDGSLLKLIPERIKGYMINDKDEHKIDYYLYDRRGPYKNAEGKTVDNAVSQTRTTKEYEKLDPKKLMIMKLGDEPLGESLLEKVYRIWRQLQLLEDAVVIYRIVRAPERRVFYIDTGKMPSTKAEAYLERIKNKMRQKQVNKDGKLETDYNPQSLIEDYFIAQCLSLNTKISLLNGEELSLSDIITRYESGEKLFTYSVDKESNKIISGEIEWAGITRKNAELVKLTFDNGENLVCTPDHKILLRTGEYKEAQHLSNNDSLMPLYRKRVKTNKNQKINKYEMIQDVSKNYNYNHKLISIEILNYREDTGCLTIKDAGDNHNFAISAGIFVKNSGEGRGSRVETLPGGDNLGRIEDLQYFNKKLVAGLRIPASYMDRFGDDVNGASVGDGRVGMSYVNELRYAGFIKRLQRTIAKELFKNFKKFAKKLGTELPEELELNIAPPQNFAVYSENEKFSTLLNTYASAEGVESLSKKYALEKFMGFDKDELMMNEEGKLMEMGYSEKDIKKMDDHIKYNLVYGDGDKARSEMEEETPPTEEELAATAEEDNNKNNQTVTIDVKTDNKQE